MVIEAIHRENEGRRRCRRATGAGVPDRAAHAQQWGLYSYHVGNRHQPVMITKTEIVRPDVGGVEQLLEQQDIPFARATLAFTPAGSASGHDQ
jgi:urease accessory protein UreE